MIIHNVLLNTYQFVDIQFETKKNSFGEPIYGGKYSHPCRFSFKYEENKSPSRESLDYDARCYLYPDASVKVGCKITFENEEYIVVEKYQPRDLSGSLAHTKLYLKKYGKS
jgi:hypothetical protein